MSKAASANDAPTEMKKRVRGCSLKAFMVKSSLAARTGSVFAAIIRCISVTRMLSRLMTKQFAICPFTAWLPACLLLFLWGCSENPVRQEPHQSREKEQLQTIDEHLRGLVKTGDRMFFGQNAPNTGQRIWEMSDEFKQDVRSKIARLNSFKLAVFGAEAGIVTSSMMDAATLDAINVDELNKLALDLELAFAQFMDLDEFGRFVDQAQAMFTQHPQLRHASKSDLKAHLGRALGDRLQKADCEGECWDDTWSDILTLVGGDLVGLAGCGLIGTFTITLGGWVCVAGMVIFNAGQIWDIADNHSDCIAGCKQQECYGKSDGRMCAGWNQVFSHNRT